MNVAEQVIFNKVLPRYENPKAYFTSTEKSQTAADAESIRSSGEKLGRQIGTFDAENEFWNKTLKPIAGQMDVIYNYRSIMFANMVVPKRLIIQNGGVTKDKNVIIFRHTKLIPVGEFSIVKSPPTWRDFFPTQPLRLPTASVNTFDLTKSNLKIWNEGLRSGYQQGVCLSLLDYKQALENLKEDFSERFAYAIAAKRGVTMPPDIKSVKVPMEMQGDTIDLDSVIYKVEDKGTFESPKTWGEFK